MRDTNGTNNIIGIIFLGRNIEILCVRRKPTRAYRGFFTRNLRNLGAGARTATDPLV